MLIDRGRAVLGGVGMATASEPALRQVTETAASWLERLDQPMRVAVAGQIKKGKSTLVNALLGGEVVATGTLELTFNVNELVHRDTPGLLVHFRDGRAPEERPVDDLAELTARSEENLALLRSIRRIEVYLPNPFLKEFRLLDTPGINSVYEQDEENALAALGRSKAQVEGESSEAVDRADAVLYVFSRALHATDQGLVAELGGTADRLTPLNTVGLLSRCDAYWPPEPGDPRQPDPLTADPLETAQRIADRYQSDLAVGQLFYQIIPFSGLVAAGGQQLTGEERDWLAELAKIDLPILHKRLRDRNRFANADLADLNLPAAERSQLASRLGPYGVFVACRFLAHGGDPGADLTVELVRASGVERIRRVVLDHFGNRATVIKLDGALASLRHEFTVARGGPLSDQARALLDDAWRQVEELSTAERCFAELDVLGALYRGQLDLTDAERAEIQVLTGERGTTCAARLGKPENTTPRELASVAQGRIAHWRTRLGDPMLEPGTELAARTVQRSYERIAHAVSEAQRLLDLDG